MAKQRYVNTKFWSDNFVSELNPLDRYLFLYFLTNEHTNIAGIYELPLKTIAFETGIEIDMLKKMLKHLLGKIAYIDGWVCIKNFQKHQSSDSLTVKKGIEVEMAKIPLDIRNKIDYGYPIDTPRGPIIYPNVDINVDINVDTNNSADAQKILSKQISEIIKAFEEVDPKNKTYYKNKTQREACQFLIDTYGFDKVIELIPKLKETNKKSVYQITNPWDMKEKITKVFNDISRIGEISKSKNRKHYG